MSKHVIHIRSGVVNKLPEPNQIELGEIAVNFAAENEKLSIKNSSGDIISFATERYVNNLINNLSGDVINNLNDLSGAVVELSASTVNIENNLNILSGVVEDFSGSVVEVIVDNEKVTSAALNDLNDRIKAVSGRTVDLTGYATEDWVNSQGYLTEHQSLAGLVSNAEYVSSAKTIEFYNLSGETLATIDATDFIKDGMVNSVAIATPTSGVHSGESCLVITFNTDSGKEDIEIPLTDIFDPDKYYTKEEINILLEGLSGNTSGQSVSLLALSGAVINLSASTVIIEENLNNLSGAVRDLSASTVNIENNVNILSGNVFELSASTVIIENNLNNLSGVVRELSASTVVIEGNLNDLSGVVSDLSASTVNIENNVNNLSGAVIDFSGAVIEVIADNELVISSALNDLNDRIKAVSGRTVDLTGYATEDWVNSQGFLKEHQSLAGLVSEVEYVTSSKTIEFRDLSGTVVSSIDTEEFASAEITSLSGVVRELSASTVNIENNLNDLSGVVRELSASTVNIENNLNILSGVVEDFSGSVVTVIEEDELAISAALNDLNDRVIVLSGTIADFNDQSVIGLSASTIIIDNKVDSLSASTINIENGLNTLSGNIITNVNTFSGTTNTDERLVSAGVLHRVITDNEYATSQMLNNFRSELNELWLIVNALSGVTFA